MTVRVWRFGVWRLAFGVGRLALGVGRLALGVGRWAVHRSLVGFSCSCSCSMKPGPPRKEIHHPCSPFAGHPSFSGVERALEDEDDDEHDRTPCTRASLTYMISRPNVPLCSDSLVSSSCRSVFCWHPVTTTPKKILAGMSSIRIWTLAAKFSRGKTLNRAGTALITGRTGTRGWRLALPPPLNHVIGGLSNLFG